MSRVYTTILNQNWYDIVIQKFGSLNDMDKVMRAVGELNNQVPFGTTMTLDDTKDELGRQFDFNKAYFATGDQKLPVPGGKSYSNDYSTDYH